MPTSATLVEYFTQYVTAQRRARIDEVLQLRTRHLTIVLEDIYQPHNASAVLRSCDCFGLQDVHIIENRNAYRVSPDVDMGASKWLTLHRYNQTDADNTERCVAALRTRGYRLLAASPHAEAANIADAELTSKTAVLFGTEELGLTPAATGAADGSVHVPMYGFTESFNISVCAALILSRLTQQLRDSGVEWELSNEEKQELRLIWLKQSIRRADELEKQFLAQGPA
jgi:tRNA (guanosine-2'-O-)-methyltransferase